jgi:hypothetical protein
LNPLDLFALTNIKTRRLLASISAQFLAMAERGRRRSLWALNAFSLVSGQTVPSRYPAQVTSHHDERNGTNSREANKMNKKQNQETGKEIPEIPPQCETGAIAIENEGHDCIMTRIRQHRDDKQKDISFSHSC